MEIRAVRKRGSGYRINLHNGRFLTEEGGRYVYDFAFDDEVNLRDDTAVSLSVPGRDDVGGAVVGCREGRLIVALDEDIGPVVLSVRLQSDESYLLTRLDERLRKVAEDSDGKFHLVSARYVLGSEPHGLRTRADQPPESVLAELDDQQRAAVEQCLGDGVTFLWGPPGTGKTTVVAAVVQAHYLAGRSVLLVSNTNAAVDTALEGVCHGLTDDPEIKQGKVLRHGPLMLAELKQRYGDVVDLDRVLSKLGTDLTRRRDEAAAEAAKCERMALGSRAAVAKYEADQSARGRVRTATETLYRSLAASQRARDQHDSLLVEREQLGRNLTRAERLGDFRRRLARLENPEAYRSALIDVAQEISEAEKKTEAAERSVSQCESDRARSQSLLVSASAELVGLAPEATARAALEVTDRKIAKWLAVKREAEEALAKLRREVLDNCRVLATTATRLSLPGMPQRDFDVVVVDEASMVALPMAFFAAGLARRSVVIAGDFRQLPVIAADSSQLTADWFTPDAFTKTGIKEQFENGIRPQNLVILHSQYRMRGAICNLVNDMSYADAPLDTAREDSPRRNLPDLIAGGPLLLIDTSTETPWCAYRSGSGSRYNLLHALIVQALVRRLEEAGFLSSGEHSEDELAVISPYVAQTRLVASLLGDLLERDGNAYASTVHRFQGNEKTLVVLDLTEAPGAGGIGRLLQGDKDDPGGRLLNVAVSRAQDVLLVIADVAFLRSKWQSGGSLQRLVEHLERHGRALSLKDVLAEDELDFGFERHRHVRMDFDTSSAVAFDERAFVAAFMQDIAEATGSAVIFSPYCTEAGTSRWLGPLREAIERGVKVRIVLRPFSGSASSTQVGLQQRIDLLRTIGCVVDERVGMHEKVAIIDSRVLWHGSLNILSHRDTTESMLRIPAEGACAELARFLLTSWRGREFVDGLATPENPPCRQCGSPTRYKRNAAGVLFVCCRPGCQGVFDPDSSESPETLQGVGQPCPNPDCNGGKLVVRKSRYGTFLGCSNYGRTRCPGPKWNR
jgi:hypothetical protein